MAYCARCGHDLGDLPTCARCGAPAPRVAPPGAASSTSPRLVLPVGDTAERPSVVAAPAPPVVPPPAMEPPPSNARFPLFADEVPEQGRPLLVDRPAGGAHRAAVWEETDTEGEYVATEEVAARRDLGTLLPWILLGVAAAGIVLVTAVWLLTRPGSGADSAADRPQSSSSGQDSSTGPSASADDDTGSGGGPSDGSGARPGGGRDVTRGATALVPATAAPNLDVRGRRVDYAAANLFDGDRTTAWRMPGDGTGELLEIRLPRPTEIRQVGLVNGYAKQVVDPQGRTIRWYLRNRRVTEVTWSFDDGSVVRQSLRQRPVLQTVDVGSEVTRTIRLRLVAVTAPMGGGLGRDFTAISEISLRGAPAR